MARAGTALALAFLLALPLLAQEEGPEIDEEMLRVCPELERASPREKEQLVALFFEFEPGLRSAEEKERVRSLFDLANAEDAALLSRYLEAPGRPRAISGLRAVFQAHGEAGLLWLLERYAGATPAVRARLMSILVVFDEGEVWRLLQAALADRTRVPNPEAAQIAPPGYVDLRICDHAMQALGVLFDRAGELELPMERSERAVHSTMPVEERDKKIERLGAFLSVSKEYDDFLAERSRLEDGLADTEKERAREVCEKLGILPG